MRRCRFFERRLKRSGAKSDLTDNRQTAAERSDGLVLIN
jgi:hypothetical protein